MHRINECTHAITQVSNTMRPLHNRIPTSFMGTSDAKTINKERLACLQNFRFARLEMH